LIKTANHPNLNQFVEMAILLSFTLFICLSSYSQYNVKCKNILNPDLNIEYVRKNSDFWIKHAYDSINGGFFSNIDRYGNVMSLLDVHTNKYYKRKSFISQSRHGYGFTRAFMLTGDENYLNYAKVALNFLFKNGWDSNNDGWYCFAKEDGSIDHGQWWDPNNEKWGFQQHYALVGILANYEATHDTIVKNWLNKGINSLYTHMWDSRNGFEGYYSDAGIDWTSPTGKGFTPTVDAITTNAELTYLLFNDLESRNRFLQLAGIITNRFITMMSDSSIKVLFPENYNTNWDADMTATDGSIGHFLKTSWCLGRAYLCDTTKSEFKYAAQKILDQSWDYSNGSISIWDHTNGGPFNVLNITTGMWGSNGGDNKDYWTIEQGFTAPMINYYISGNKNYLQMADEALSFFMQHQVDSIYGEIFSELDPTGYIIRSGIKADEFKASYHSNELGYFAYLYSNLFYLNKPVGLYYKFEPSTQVQTIKLNPISIEDNKLKIKSVTLDGENFVAFDKDKRTLTIEPGQGGKFKVIFELQQNDQTELTSYKENKCSIYPNPTRRGVNINYDGEVSELKITDISGKAIMYFDNQIKSNQFIDLDNTAPGIYFVTIRKKDGVKYTLKLIKQ